MTDCDSCRSVCSLESAQWVPLGIIRLCRPQVLFVMEYILLLRNGKYPQRPTGYTGIDPAIRSVPRLTAQWCQVAELASEIDARLATVPGIQRKLFEVETAQGMTIDELSHYSRSVLNYVSGFRRRRENFRQFQSRKVDKKSIMVTMR